MPSARYVSGSRGQEGCISYRLATTHYLQVNLGSESDSALINLSKFLPFSVDVVLLENLRISLSVFVDGVRWSNQKVRTSIVARHLVHFLRKNASFMAINHVSDAYIDDEDGDAVKVGISPKYRVVELAPSTPLATLQYIHLTYKIKSNDDGDAVNSTFSIRILNELVNRFVIFQLIRRYPLIFQHKGLHRERHLFPSVARSLMTMSERSPNVYFQQQVRRHVKLLKKRLKAADHRAREDLRHQCGIEEDDLPIYAGHTHENETSIEEVLCSAMQQLYKLAIRSSSFKGQDVGEDELISTNLNDQEPVLTRIQSLSQQEVRHEGQSAIEALVDIVNSSDDLNIYRSEGGRSESDWEHTEWPALPSPPSSLPVGELDPSAPSAHMKDGQTIACDDVMMPDDFEESHGRHSQPQSSLASLPLCDSDVDNSALQADFDYSSGDSVSICEENGSYEYQASHSLHVPSDFDFTEDDEPTASTASQGPRRDDGLLDFRYEEEEAVLGVPATNGDEFDAATRVNSGMDELLDDDADFLFERERRLSGHEAASMSTSITHGMASFDKVLGSARGLSKDSPLSGSQNSGHWPATFPLQPSMSPPPSAHYFERSESGPIGLDLTCDFQDDYVVHEWDLTASRGSPSASTSAASTDVNIALDDNVARRGQHCELDFNQRPSAIGYSPDRLEDVDWDDIEEEEAFRITDVDMEIGVGDKPMTFGWSREEEELELELEC